MINTEMTGLDTLIGVGYRRGDKQAFAARSAVSNATRIHEQREVNRHMRYEGQTTLNRAFVLRDIKCNLDATSATDGAQRWDAVY